MYRRGVPNLLNSIKTTRSGSHIIPNLLNILGVAAETSTSQDMAYISGKKMQPVYGLGLFILFIYVGQYDLQYT